MSGTRDNPEVVVFGTPHPDRPVSVAQLDSGHALLAYVEGATRRQKPANLNALAWYAALGLEPASLDNVHNGVLGVMDYVIGQMQNARPDVH